MNSLTALGTVRGIMAFIEAFLTVQLAGLGGVMVQGQAYAWPSFPAFAFISAGGILAGVRRVNALMADPEGG